MTQILTNVKTILTQAWSKEFDGKWYVHVPCDCNEDDDIILEFADPEEYINEHKKDFDLVEDAGITKNNEFVLIASGKPECDIHVSVSFLQDKGGQILYDKNGKPTYVPPQNNFDIGNLLSNIQPGNKDIIDNITSDEDKNKIIV